MAGNNTRISRVQNSWRVRVHGHKAQFFADVTYGGKQQSLKAARVWRDRHWDGRERRLKLTPADRRAIRKSTEYYKDVAERYGIAPNYVHQIRRGG